MSNLFLYEFFFLISSISSLSLSLFFLDHQLIYKFFQVQKNLYLLIRALNKLGLLKPNIKIGVLLYVLFDKLFILICYKKNCEIYYFYNKVIFRRFK